MPIQSDPQFAAIAAAASGNNTLVAAVTGKRIRVLGFVLVGAGAVTAKFQSGAGGTDLTGAMTMAAASVVAVPPNEPGCFETAVGALLNLNLSAAVSVAGLLVYRTVE
ncbi:MAG: hypothetical protein AB7G23_19270 [Vicinamibacterales bacterium]